MGSSKIHTLQVHECGYSRKEKSKNHFDHTWKYILKSASRKSGDIKAEIKIVIASNIELALEKDQFIDMALVKNQKRLDEFNDEQLEKINRKSKPNVIRPVKKRKK